MVVGSTLCDSMSSIKFLQKNQHHQRETRQNVLLERSNCISAVDHSVAINIRLLFVENRSK